MYHIYKFKNPRFKFKNLNKLFVKNLFVENIFRITNLHTRKLHLSEMSLFYFSTTEEIEFIQRIRKKKKKKRCFRCTNYKYSLKFFFFYFLSLNVSNYKEFLESCIYWRCPFFSSFFSFFVTVEEIKAILHRWSIVICRVWTFRRVW